MGSIFGGQFSGGQLSYLALGFATIDPSVTSEASRCIQSSERSEEAVAGVWGCGPQRGPGAESLGGG